MLTCLSVANTPAEITHLLEEIQAKDAQIMLYKDEITKRDMALQKWVRVNGGHVQNPKEEAFSKTINDCYDKCEILQAEKCGLSEKALIVLERQIKRMDVGLRSLSVREEFPGDWNGPSLLSGSATGVSTPVTGGPLQAISGNVGASGPGGPNIANAAQLRMAQTSAASRVGGTTTPASAPRSQRESSSEASKRRRLNQSLGAVPTPASHLRQSSLGPGTPKAGTPVPASSSSRAGSAQPSRPAATHQKKAGPTAVATNTARKPIPASSSKDSRKRARHANASQPNAANTTKKPSRRNRDGTASTTSLSASPSPAPSSLARNQADGNASEEEGEDTTLYCFCQKVSFGDMVGCDNDDCKYQWFHWGCVGLKSEPAGEWLCPECRKGKEG